MHDRKYICGPKVQKMPANYYFVIVGHDDNPLYELLDVCSVKDFKKNQTEESRHLIQFLAHSALDFVDEHMWRTGNVWLKQVDRFNQWNVTAYVTAAGTKLITVHDAKTDDHIRNFCTKVHELFVEFSLNPFYEFNTAIKCQQFDAGLKNLAKKYLT